MSTLHDHDIPALDELGRRLEVAAARQRRGRRTPRRVLLVAVVALVAAATPAVGSITGVFHSHSTLEETMPRVAAAIDPADPAATARALRRLGIDVRWSFVEDAAGGPWPTRSRTVSAPPPGTEVLSVLGADGSADVDEKTRTLLIEVAPATSKVLREHR